MKKSVGIIGAAGFTGYELIKLLINHPHVELKVLNSRSKGGKKVSEVYPDFQSEEDKHRRLHKEVQQRDLRFTSIPLNEINVLGLDVLFLCMPNGEALQCVPKINKKTKIIDLSADYRFANKKIYEKVYGIIHTDKKTKAVYGLPELNRTEIKKARVVANPGCYATACILAALPLVKNNLVKILIADCKSGYSGAGKESDYAKHPELLEDNIIPYKLTTHRHTAEIEQTIKFPISFTPHVMPNFQGLMATVHVFLKKKMDPEKIRALYEGFYHGEIFVKIMRDCLPTLHDVQKTNKCVLGGFEIDDKNRLVVISVLDNLIKGASGQAVQNMNLMLGFDEKEGLIENN